MFISCAELPGAVSLLGSKSWVEIATTTLFVTAFRAKILKENI